MYTFHAVFCASLAELDVADAVKIKSRLFTGRRASWGVIMKMLKEAERIFFTRLLPFSGLDHEDFEKDVAFYS